MPKKRMETHILVFITAVGYCVLQVNMRASKKAPAGYPDLGWKGVLLLIKEIV
jgi:hypothetical protein